MLVSTGLLVLVLVHLKTSAEAFNVPPPFQLPRFQRYPPTIVPQRFEIWYLINRQTFPPATARNQFISTETDINNNIVEEESNIKLKPSTLLLVEDPEEEPDYGAIFREDNEKELNQKAPENEKVHESRLTSDGRGRGGDNGHVDGRGYRNGGIWRNSASDGRGSDDHEVGRGYGNGGILSSPASDVREIGGENGPEDVRGYRNDGAWSQSSNLAFSGGWNIGERKRV